MIAACPAAGHEGSATSAAVAGVVGTSRLGMDVELDVFESVVAAFVEDGAIVGDVGDVDVVVGDVDVVVGASVGAVGDVVLDVLTCAPASWRWGRRSWDSDHANGAATATASTRPIITRCDRAMGGQPTGVVLQSA